jgi:AdoMet-dependent heme synthase
MNVLSWPAIYALELTPACNNRCPGCSNIYSHVRQPAATDAATWERWLAQFVPEAIQIRLTGGEPTLHPEFFRILAAATAYDAQVTIFTNGRWSDPATLVRRLQGWPRLSGLLVSLHGAQPKSHEAFSRVAGSFDETVANIRLALDASIPVALSTIITRWSWRELEAIAEMGQRLGVQHVAFNRYLGAPDCTLEPTKTQMESAVKTIESMVRAGTPVKYGIGMPQCFQLNSSEGCLAGVAYVAIDPWGRLHPCAHSPSFVGSLHEAPLYQLWRGSAMDAWRALMPAECAECAAYAACHGGCRAVQELRANRRDPLRRQPFASFDLGLQARDLPADGRPLAQLRLRPESFGYAVLGHGQIFPVRSEARPVIEACDGTATFAQLAAQYGQDGLDILGDLWEAGLVDIC